MKLDLNGSVGHGRRHFPIEKEGHWPLGTPL